jgi:hypothetical protein
MNYDHRCHDPDAEGMVLAILGDRVMCHVRGKGTAKANESDNTFEKETISLEAR